MELSIRNTEDYEFVIDEIGKIMTNHNLSYVESFGVLESVKNQLFVLSIQDGCNNE